MFFKQHKNFKNILASLVRYFADKNCQKSPNLVTLGDNCRLATTVPPFCCC